MFTEILKIKPVLDESTAKQMENSLHGRFARVAGRFGSGLKAVIKGSVLGISLALLSKLLSPLETLDEKIKGLLGHGKDTQDLADRLGSSSGEVEQLKAVAGSFDVAPEKFNELILHFAQSVEKAREELANPLQEKSASTLALAPFTKQTNIVQGFKDFMLDLQKTKAGGDTFQPQTAHATNLLAKANTENSPLSYDQIQSLVSNGELRQRSGAETAIAKQRDVFGEQQFGGVKKLLESNIEDQSAKLKLPSVSELGKASDKLAGLEAQKVVIDIKNQTQDLIESSKKMNEEMIRSMGEFAKVELERSRKDFDNYTVLKKAAVTVEEIKGFVTDINNGILKVLSYFAPASNSLNEIAKSRMLKGLAKDVGQSWK